MFSRTQENDNPQQPRKPELPAMIRETVIHMRASGVITDHQLAVLFGEKDATDPEQPCAPDRLAQRICEEAYTALEARRAELRKAYATIQELQLQIKSTL